MTNIPVLSRNEISILSGWIARGVLITRHILSITIGVRAPGQEAIASVPLIKPGPEVAVRLRTPARDAPLIADIVPISSSAR